MNNIKHIIDVITKGQKKHTEFRVGDTIKVHVKIREGEKERIQIFEGSVIKKRRGGDSASFTVRKISYGIGVERIFAFSSPSVEKIEVVLRGKVRRARLFYLRNRKGKETVIDGTLEPIEGAKSVKKGEGILAAKTSSASAVVASLVS